METTHIELQVGTSTDLSVTYCVITVNGVEFSRTVNTWDLAGLRCWIRDQDLPAELQLKALRDLEICEARYEAHLMALQSDDCRGGSLIAASVIAASALALMFLIWFSQ